MKLNWKKATFSDTYKLYDNGREVGELVDKTFSSISTGSLLNKKFRFETKGFLKQTTDVFDVETNKKVGNITYNGFGSKATATFNNETFVWKYENIWNSKWSFNQKEKALVTATLSSKGGTAVSRTEEAVYLITALFINNYYKKLALAAMIAIFIPIWMASIN